MNTVLFDLDGTLLLMEQEAFIKRYLGLLCQTAAQLGLEPESVTAALWKGTYAMVKNDGTVNNHQRFWDCFATELGEEVRAAEPVFDEFYVGDFALAQDITEPNPLAQEAVHILTEKGYTVALATNPLFPPGAVQTRLGWLNLTLGDFAYVTNYQNSHYCKPNLNYFRVLLKELAKQPEECLMVGNNLREDMCARELGMQVYLVTNYLENVEAGKVEDFPHGTFADFMEYVRQLPAVG